MFTVNIMSNTWGVCWEPGAVQALHSHGGFPQLCGFVFYLQPISGAPEESLRAVPTLLYSLECFEDHLVTSDTGPEENHDFLPCVVLNVSRSKGNSLGMK